MTDENSTEGIEQDRKKGLLAGFALGLAATIGGAAVVTTLLRSIWKEVPTGSGADIRPEPIRDPSLERKRNISSTKRLVEGIMLQEPDIERVFFEMTRETLQETGRLMSEMADFTSKRWPCDKHGNIALTLEAARVSKYEADYLIGTMPNGNVRTLRLGKVRPLSWKTRDYFDALLQEVETLAQEGLRSLRNSGPADAVRHRQ